MTHLSYRLTWPNLIHPTYWVQSHLGTYEYVWILYHTINLRKKNYVNIRVIMKMRGETKEKKDEEKKEG